MRNNVFSTNGTGTNGHLHLKKKKRTSQPFPHITCKEDNRPVNVNETIKFLKENRRKSCDLGLGKDFLGHNKAQTLKQKLTDFTSKLKMSTLKHT